MDQKSILKSALVLFDIILFSVLVAYGFFISGINSSGDGDFGFGFALIPLMLGGITLLALVLYTVSVFRTNSIYTGNKKDNLIFIFLIVAGALLAYFGLPYFF